MGDMTDNIESAGEHAESQENNVEPCLFCRKKPLVRNAYGSFQPRINHSCGFVDIHEGSINDWNNAWAHKRIAELEREVEELKNGK